nr:putative ATP-dependent RNA helicase TDRD12 isoform X3 [Megalopta genalis]XP_033337679.1 putative ATP-dependent RNA helicase TDRD12 isoform X3 [Megalopta genalis]XP_033337681.1 putative ATP-dependent RNA helicase TDRD12 isoform X3 [Megalopta genalis]XP_033337682.1 putative ATP-dependent RNA helicase TDRD12 isoform X3 [Megalopta genalis]
MIRIFEKNDYERKLNLINKKLIVLEKRRLFKVNTEHTKPNIGDTIITHDKLNKNVDLPAWLCRGIISNILNTTNTEYHVFLPDYGIAVILQKYDFYMYSANLIQEEYLTYTVGLYNVLPTVLQFNSQGDTSLLLLDEWDKSAIEYTNKLLAASSTIYFDHLAFDTHGRKYGEFYLNIRGTIIRLSKALCLNNAATYLPKDTMKFLLNPLNHEKLKKEVVNDEVIFYINVSKEHKEQDRNNVQEERIRKCKMRNQLLDNTREKEKVLIYGEIKYEPLCSISDLRLPAEIHKTWTSLVKSSRPRKIQSYILPAVKNGLDVIAIGSAQSGKTFACGLAISGLLASKPSFPQGVSPVALILCSSTPKVLEVHYLCTEFFQNYRTIRSVAAFNGKSERSLAAEMYNGCQVLVSTPRFLARFIDRNKKLVNFENLQHFILEDIDVILDRYFDSISKLLKKHKIICNRELKDMNATLQIIATAKHWTSKLKKFALALMDCPYICIASFIEATIFKSVRPKMYIVNTKSKANKVLDLVSNIPCNLRTVVVCINSDEAKTLQEFLKLNNKDVLLAHEDMNLISLQGIKQCWDACISGSYPILICTDEVLSDLNVTNADWLIHYSISLRFMTQFNFRFSTLFNSLQKEKSGCNVTIIVDENSDIQFLSVINLMRRMNIIIPQNMLENIEHVRDSLEKKKENYALCNNIKLWGFCYKDYSCMLRHTIIPEMDLPTIDIGVNDEVKFRLVSIHNVTQISARIISYIKFGTSEEVELSNVEYMAIIVKIQKYYSSMDNRFVYQLIFLIAPSNTNFEYQKLIKHIIYRRRCESVNVGDICGLEEPVDSYKRVEILSIAEEGRTDQSKYANVKCIDNGVILNNVNVYRLLHMPEHFRKYPAQVTEVIVTGIAPHDEEYVWSRCATDAVFQWFKDNVDERSYITGTVILHLKNIIWVNTLKVGTKLVGYKDIVGSSLKAELLKNDYAVENHAHLPKIYELCKRHSFPAINDISINHQT